MVVYECFRAGDGDTGRVGKTTRRRLGGEGDEWGGSWVQVGSQAVEVMVHATFPLDAVEVDDGDLGRVWRVADSAEWVEAWQRVVDARVAADSVRPTGPGGEKEEEWAEQAAAVDIMAEGGMEDENRLIGPLHPMGPVGFGAGDFTFNPGWPHYGRDPLNYDSPFAHETQYWLRFAEVGHEMAAQECADAQQWHPGIQDIREEEGPWGGDRRR